MAVKFDKILGVVRESDSVSLANVLKYQGIITTSTQFPYLSAVSNADLYVVSGTVTDNIPNRTNTGLTFYNGEEIAWLSSTNAWNVIGSTTYAQFNSLSSTVAVNSGNWNSSFTTLSANSGNWTSAYNNIISKPTSSTLNAVSLWGNTSGTSLINSNVVLDSTSLTGGTFLNMEFFAVEPPVTASYSGDAYFSFISGSVYLNFNAFGTIYKVELNT